MRILKASWILLFFNYELQKTYILSWIIEKLMLHESGIKIALWQYGFRANFFGWLDTNTFVRRNTRLIPTLDHYHDVKLSYWHTEIMVLNQQCVALISSLGLATRLWQLSGSKYAPVTLPLNWSCHATAIQVLLRILRLITAVKHDHFLIEYFFTYAEMRNFREISIKRNQFQLTSIKSVSIYITKSSLNVKLFIVIVTCIFYLILTLPRWIMKNEHAIDNSNQPKRWRIL